MDLLSGYMIYLGVAGGTPAGAVIVMLLAAVVALQGGSHLPQGAAADGTGSLRTVGLPATTAVPAACHIIMDLATPIADETAVLVLLFHNDEVTIVADSAYPVGVRILLAATATDIAACRVVRDFHHVENTVGTGLALLGGIGGGVVALGTDIGVHRLHQVSAIRAVLAFFGGVIALAALIADKDRIRRSLQDLADLVAALGTEGPLLRSSISCGGTVRIGAEVAYRSRQRLFLADGSRNGAGLAQVGGSIVISAGLVVDVGGTIDTAVLRIIADINLVFGLPVQGPVAGRTDISIRMGNRRITIPAHLGVVAYPSLTAGAGIGTAAPQQHTSVAIRAYLILNVIDRRTVVTATDALGIVPGSMLFAAITAFIDLQVGGNDRRSVTNGTNLSIGSNIGIAILMDRAAAIALKENIVYSVNIIPLNDLVHTLLADLAVLAGVRHLAAAAAGIYVALHHRHGAGATALGAGIAIRRSPIQHMADLADGQALALLLDLLDDPVTVTLGAGLAQLVCSGRLAAVGAGVKLLILVVENALNDLIDALGTILTQHILGVGPVTAAAAVDIMARSPGLALPAAHIALQITVLVHLHLILVIRLSAVGAGLAQLVPLMSAFLADDLDGHGV